jgi:uncharacterized protein YuzE
MSVRIGDWTFHNVVYDADADVLYLSLGTPREGYGEETPEGHFLRYDDQDRFCGITLIDARHLKDRGELFVTVPKRERVDLPTGQLAGSC